MRKVISVCFVCIILFAVCFCGCSLNKGNLKKGNLNEGEILLTEINCDKVRNSMLDNLKVNGIYMIQNEEYSVIILKKDSNKFYSSKGQIEDNNINIYYEEVENTDDSGIIYERSYLINNSLMNDNTKINLFMNDEVVSFEQIIAIEEQILK